MAGQKSSTADDSSQIQAGEISWQTAKENIGKQATVCGEIIEVARPIPIASVLGMGKSVRDPGAVGIEISDSDKAQFPEDLYIGKTICVTGTVKLNPLGGAKLELADPSKVVVK